MHDRPSFESNAEDRFAGCQLHGVLVRVFDTGVLLIGESGVGKSECAFDLIDKGHRLVADDAVQIFCVGGRLQGKSPESIRNLIEVRGVGIVNAVETFGLGAVSDESDVELCVELQRGAGAERFDGSVFDYRILDQTIPKLVLSVSPARSSATAVETAVRLHRLRNGGGTPPVERRIGVQAEPLVSVQ
jgi:HPr kinase/phosphorylase